MFEQPSHYKRCVPCEWGKSYLCGSVPVRKSLAKPAGQVARGGCSQCGPAMGRSEGAFQRYSGGWRIGLTDARVSAAWAKRTCRVMTAGLGGFRRLSHRATRVLRVVTWRKRSFSHTIELPLRPQARPAVTEGYKAVPKSPPYAVVSGSSFLRSALWGTQQSQSSRLSREGAAIKGSSSGSPARLRRFGQVSSPAQAAFGPWRASSRLNPGSAKQQSVTSAVAFRDGQSERQVRKENR